MPTKEIHEKLHEDSDSEGEEDSDLDNAMPKIDIDPSKLTPLSPEVISKQASVIKISGNPV
jgi:translation initiation factor 2 subunit 3